MHGPGVSVVILCARFADIVLFKTEKYDEQQQHIVYVELNGAELVTFGIQNSKNSSIQTREGKEQSGNAMQ